MLCKKVSGPYLTIDGVSAYKDADFVVIAISTNYDPINIFFDAHHIEYAVHVGILEKEIKKEVMQ